MIEATILEVAFLERRFATLFNLLLCATRACLIIALSLCLHQVSILVFKFNTALSHIANELSSDFSTLGQENPTAAHTPIILPLTIIEVTVCVVVNTSSVPGVILKVAFVVFAVLEKNLDLAIKHFIAIETALNYFAG